MTGESATPSAPPLRQRLRRVVGVLVLLVALILSWWGLSAVGATQQGNYLAFLGSLAMVLPAARQMWSNAPYGQAERTNPRAEALKQIKVEIGGAQVLNYVQFSWFDALAYFVGALLLAVGFLIQVLGLSIPA